MHQGGVGEGAVAAVTAHAVGAELAAVGAGADDLAARAHAEGGDVAELEVTGRARDQLVLGGTEQSGALRLAVAAAVDQALRMLDAAAQLPALALMGHALFAEATDQLTGAMARGMMTASAFRLSPFVRVRRGSDHPPRAIRRPGCASGSYAPGLDLLAQVTAHGRQDVGTDVWMGAVAYVARGLGADESLEQEAGAGILDPGVELAVRIGAGAALAEEVVALRVELAAGLEGGDVGLALVHGLAAFEHQHLAAVHGQQVGSHEAGRTAADDDDLAARPRAVEIGEEVVLELVALRSASFASTSRR